MPSAPLPSPRFHTRIVIAYVLLLALGQALTSWFIQRGIEHNVRLTVRASLLTTERWLRTQLPASSVDPARATPLPPATEPTTADVHLRGVLQDTHNLLGPDVLLMVRSSPHASWRLHSSTLEPPVAQALFEQWLSAPQGPADRALTLPHGEHLGRALTLSSPGDDHQVRAIILSSLDDVRATYRHLQHTLLAVSLLCVATFAAVSLWTARRLTRRDRLTDLPHRERFRQKLHHELARAGHGPTAVLMLDMDRFKHVNDQLGHRFGDNLLQALATRLRAHAKSQARAVLARLGGDEFGLLLPRTNAAQAQLLAQRILADFERPFELDGHKVDLSAGIGIAASPEHAQDADTLLGRAEIAMYAAKQRRTGAVTYQAELEPEADSTLTLLGELRQAVDQGELRLFLQPKVKLQNGQVVGAEALVRWQHPVRGVLPPRGFVPFAEQTGFVRLLTGWMLEEVTRTARQLADQGLSVKLSVNLSTRDLMDRSLPERLAALLAQHRVPAQSLVLEITESAIMDDPQRAQMTLERLHRMGLRLSIDDFGTGHASLAYLKALPVDELKIDRSFVQDMIQDGHDAKIVSSTIELAHSLGLSVVAEGVEDPAAWQHLASLGCDEAQGHLVARPMPAEQFATWARNWRPPQP